MTSAITAANMIGTVKRFLIRSPRGDGELFFSPL